MGPSGVFEMWFIVGAEATLMWDPGDSRQLGTPIQVSLGTVMENVLEMLWIRAGAGGRCCRGELEPRVREPAPGAQQ